MISQKKCAGKSTVSANNLSLFSYIFLFLFFFTLYYNFMIYFEPFVFEKNLIFYADTAFTHRWIESFNINKKHVLFSPVVNSLFRLISHVSQTEENHAIIIVLSFLASINIVLAYSILKLFINREGLSILFTFLYGFAFSNLILFSIPETYVVTVLTILVHFYLLARFRNNLNFGKVILLTITVALASLSNPPLLLLLVPTCYIFYRCFNLRRFVKMFFFSSFISGAIFLISNMLVQGKFFFSYVSGFANRPTISMSNFLKMEHIKNILANFLFFSVISPYDTLGNSTAVQDFLRYFSSPVKVVLLFSYIFYLFPFLSHIIGKRNRLVEACSLFILSIMMFYVYFYPMEAMMYPSQILFPMTLILANVFKSVKFKYKSLFLTSFLIIFVFNNCFCIWSWLLEKGNEKNVRYARTKGFLRKRITQLEEPMPSLYSIDRRGEALASVLNSNSREVKKFLIERGITEGYVEGAPLSAFKIDWRITVTDDRNRDYPEKRSSTDSVSSPAYILVGKSALNFYEGLRATGGDCKYDRFGLFHIFYDFLPPPSCREPISREGWKATSNYNPDIVGKAFDDDIDTYWTTDKSQRGGMYYQIDLGQVYELNGVSMLSPKYFNDHARICVVEVSLDGRRWENAIAGSEESRYSYFWIGERFFWKLAGDRKDISFKATPARFLRIKQMGHSENFWTIQEIFVFKAKEKQPELQDNFSEFVDFLDDKGIRYVYTDEWFSARFCYETDTRIETMRQYYRYHREKDMFLKFNKEECDKLPALYLGEDIALIVREEFIDYFESKLDKYRMKWRKKKIGAFNVYYNIEREKVGKVFSRKSFKAFSSHNTEDSFKAVDGDMETRWASKASQNRGMYYGVDLGEEVNLCGINLYHGKSVSDYPRGYKIEVSSDGESWEKVGYSFSGPFYWSGFSILKMGHSQGRIGISFEPVLARYVKITQTGYDSLYWWSIHEQELIESGA